MIDRIKKLLLGPSQAPAVARGDPSQAPASARGDEGLKLAAAVLMVEAAWMDQSYDVSERRAIAAALRRHFHLNELETATLIETAPYLKRSCDGVLEYTVFYLPCDAPRGAFRPACDRLRAPHLSHQDS